MALLRQCDNSDCPAGPYTAPASPTVIRGTYVSASGKTWLEYLTRNGQDGNWLVRRRVGAEEGEDPANGVTQFWAHSEACADAIDAGL